VIALMCYLKTTDSICIRIHHRVAVCVNVGESVPESERMSDKELLTSDALSASSSTHNLPSITQTVVGATARGGVSDEERLSWEEERQKLYLQLDERV